MHSRNIADYGGVANNYAEVRALMLFFAMANCGLPATSGFVGEFMVIVGAMKFNFWVAFLAGTTLVFGAAYTLWMVKRVISARSATSTSPSFPTSMRASSWSSGCSRSPCCGWACIPLRSPRSCMPRSTTCSSTLRRASCERRGKMLTGLPVMLLAYPEIFLLAAGCAILVIDLF